MIFTIEPIFKETSAEVVLWEDGWTLENSDQTRAAQFENTVRITEDGVEILTKLP